MLKSSVCLTYNDVTVRIFSWYSQRVDPSAFRFRASLERCRRTQKMPEDIKTSGIWYLETVNAAANSDTVLSVL